VRDYVTAIGKLPYGISSWRVAALARWRLLLVQQLRPISDTEINLLSMALAQLRARPWLELAGGGVLSLPIPANGVTTSVATIHDGSANLTALVDGSLIEVRGPADGAQIDVTLSAAPGAGSRTDLIYMEVARETVQPSAATEAASITVHRRGNVANTSGLSNDLQSAGVGAETSRRVQLRYRIKVAAGAATLSDLAADGYTWTADAEHPGQWTLGDGSALAGQTLGTVDGVRRAIPLATVARTAGQTTIASSAITVVARRVSLQSDAHTVDGYHATPTATANMLLPLDGSGKYPSGVFTGLAGSATDVDTVDTFHASATPTASKLLPLDGSGKFPVGVLKTGTGNGLDADTVDTFHASATPTASKLLPLNGSGKYPVGVLKTGSGNLLDADSVDGFGANATPTASTLLPLDGSGKFPVGALKTGAGNLLDADSVDGFGANATPTASTLLPLDGSGKFPVGVLKTGTGNGLDADTVDGNHAAALAAAVHTHGALLTGPTLEVSSDATGSIASGNTYSNNTRKVFPTSGAGSTSKKHYYYIVFTTTFHFDTTPGAAPIGYLFWSTAATAVAASGAIIAGATNLSYQSGRQTAAMQSITLYAAGALSELLTIGGQSQVIWLALNFSGGGTLYVDHWRYSIVHWLG